NSTQLLLRFRVRTVCHCNLSLLPTHGHRRVGGLKRFLSNQMSVLPHFCVVAKTLVQQGVALALRPVFDLAGLEISQTDVFHPFLPLSCGSLFPVTQSHSSSLVVRYLFSDSRSGEGKSTATHSFSTAWNVVKPETEEDNLENWPVCRA